MTVPTSIPPRLRLLQARIEYLLTEAADTGDHPMIATFLDHYRPSPWEHPAIQEDGIRVARAVGRRARFTHGWEAKRRLYDLAQLLEMAARLPLVAKNGWTVWSRRPMAKLVAWGIITEEDVTL